MLKFVQLQWIQPVLMLLCLSLLQPATVHAAAGTVQAVAGSARIIQANGQERAALKGDHLYTGDTVSTGAASNVQIRMIDDARVWLRANSRFKIEQYPGDAGSAAAPQAQAHTRLIEGSLRTVTGAIGQASPQHYSLKTPNAVIGIRGTEFEVAFFGPGLAAQMQTPAGTYHRVFQGLTALSARAGQSGGPPLMVQAGQAAFMGLEPSDVPRTLPQIPPFLNLPPPDAAASPSAGPTPPGQAPSPQTARREAAPAQARPVRLGLRMASPLADGATVVASAGAPVEPAETFALAKEGEPTRLSLTFAPPPSSRQRRAPEPPTTVVLDVTARLQEGRQAQVQIQSAYQASPVMLTLPVGVWTDITGRGSWLAGGRQTISSSAARPESAQVMVRVDPGGP